MPRLRGPARHEACAQGAGPQYDRRHAACCFTIIAGPWPQSSLQVPVFHTAFATGPAVASGIRAALDMQGKFDTTVMVWVGDGGTFDIGLQSLSGARGAQREHPVRLLRQRGVHEYGDPTLLGHAVGRVDHHDAGAVPRGDEQEDILAIMAAHNIPYAATATVAYPVDLIEKVTKARAMRGTRFIHLLSPCPPGWKCGDDEGIELARMAVQSRVFPMLEVEDGQRWRFTMEHAAEPVEPYLRRQGRFRHLSAEQVTHIQAEIDVHWKQLLRRMETEALVTA